MRGHVQKKAGNWYVVLELERENGKRQQKWISVRKELGLAKPATKRQAEELLTRKLKELQDGTYFEPAEITLAEFLLRWLNDYAKQNVRQKTYERYESLIRCHIIPELGNIQLTKLRPMHLQQFYAHKLSADRADGKDGGLSPQSVKYMHIILHEALQQAVRWELVQRNVAESVAPPRAKSTTRPTWTPEQVQKFLDAVKGHRLYPLYRLVLSTGMRMGEILGLRWQDVDLVSGYITVVQTLSQTRRGLVFELPKTEQSRRRIKISQSMCAVLREHRKQQIKEFMMLSKTDLADTLVFTSEVGTPINPRNLHRHFANTINKIGLPQIAFHDLRHTHATMLLAQGENPKIVSERLGHASVSTTLNIYSHVLPDMQEQAAEKFEDFLSPTKGEKKERI